jgi:hypothetical protein
MKVPGLTRANVSSHLQKHRLRLGQPFVRNPKKDLGKKVKGKKEKKEKKEKKKKKQQQQEQSKSPADKEFLSSIPASSSSSISSVPAPSSSLSLLPPSSPSFPPTTSSFSSTVAVPTPMLATPSSLPPPLPPLPPKVSFDFLLPRVSSFSLMPNSRTASHSFAFLLEQNQTQHQYQGFDPFLAMGFEYWNSFTSSSSSLGPPSVSGPSTSSTKTSFSNDSYVW